MNIYISDVEMDGAHPNAVGDVLDDKLKSLGIVITPANLEDVLLILTEEIRRLKCILKIS